MPNANPERLTDPARLEELRRLSLLDTPDEPAFDRLTRLAADVLNAPVALVTLIDDRRQFLKSQVGMDEPWASLHEMPLDYSYCQHVVANTAPLIVENTLENPLTADNLSTTQLNIRAYAGIPLTTSKGDVIGSFCVADRTPRQWTERDIRIMTMLSQTVIREIEIRNQLVFQRLIADALRKSEQQLTAVIAGAPVIVYVIDPDGTVIMNEGKGLEKVGLEPNSLVGRTIQDLYGNQPKVLDAMQRAVKGETLTIVLEQSILGVPKHYEIRISPLYNTERHITGVIGVATDITERVTVERTLEETIERLTILRRVDVELGETLDLNSVLTIAMDTALRATGAEHGFIGLQDGDMLHTVHTAGSYVKNSLFDSSKGIVGRAMRTQEPQYLIDAPSDPDFLNDIPNVKSQMVIPLVHRDHLVGVLNLKTTRSDLFTRDSFDFLRLLAGQITIAIDNAQLYQVSQQQLDELHRLYTRVSELEQLKTDMIRIAAHDLRNPLGVLSGYTELLLEERDTLSPIQQDFIESMQSVHQKMFKIIDDILSLQRVEAIQGGSAYKTVDIRAIVSEVFDGNAVRARQKEQDYQLTLPDAPTHVNADAAQIREAVDNLVSNAVKYTLGGGTIRVRLELKDNHVRFEVIDSGLGIPKEQQDRLFQPFFRAENARATQIEGTGLGLHLVKNIIERHGGRMYFQSAQDVGSTFGFDLPAAVNLR